jgi:hypothetical protein
MFHINGLETIQINYRRCLIEAQSNPSRFSVMLAEAKGWAGAYEAITGKSLTTFEKVVNPLTLDDVDCMALETLTLTGEIEIKEATPPDPSVGWPGSDYPQGEIEGRFEVPGAVVTIEGYRGLESMIETDDWNPGGTVLDYIETGPIQPKIETYSIDHFRGILRHSPWVRLTGVTKKGDRAVVEFKVIIKES